MKINIKKYLLLLGLSMTFGQNALALTNSMVAESPVYNYVVQIKSEAPDASGDTAPAYCVATLVHQNVLLTAAHCVKSAYVSGQKKIEIQVGSYKYVTRKTDGQVVRVGYLVKHYLSKVVNIELPRNLADRLNARGERASISPEEDFALLWWSEETPELKDIEVASIVSPLEHASIIKNVAQYKLLSVTINPFSEPSTDTKRMANLNNTAWKGYLYSKSTSRVEEGDSGSPLFALIGNKLKVFAVVKGRASTIFDNWDAYSAVNPHLCPIAKLLPTFIKIEACQ